MKSGKLSFEILTINVIHDSEYFRKTILWVYRSYTIAS